MIGVDEAGRGPVLGPLVVAGVRADDDTMASLTSWGVKDSKLLSPKRRAELAENIRDACEVHTVVFPAPDIDAERCHQSLNAIERRLFGDVILMFDDVTDVIVVDCCDTMEERFGSLLAKEVGKEIVSRHGADRAFPVVAAASIIAKTVRDHEMACLSEEAVARWGIPTGSGYPSDPATVRFLEAFGPQDALPHFVRKSWKTVTRRGQLTLDAYDE
ncbi:MAG: ribonuclease HII [Candidatus Methanofastidiosa archaeon]|nr:ribonuclease HII [Candidatus Methanofastidiosa archaeon]